MKKLLSFLLIPAFVLIWWVYQRKTDAPQVPFARVIRETLISRLSTNGRVEPLEWMAVRAETAGLVDKVVVQEGQTVAKGAALAHLSAPGLQPELASAEARAAQARAEVATIEAGGNSVELAKIENELVRARFDLDAAKRDYVALERLAERNAATRAAVQESRGKLRQAELEIEGLMRRRAALVSKSDLAVAQARLKEAEAAVQLAARRIAETIVRAPLSGVIYNLSIRPGFYLTVGDQVTNIGRLDKVRVRVYVDEPELGRIALGVPVTITWDARPGETWSGVVEKLPAAIVPLGTRQVGEVLCTIENPGRELIPGTNANAEIRSAVVPNAVTIPREALRREAGGTGVWVLDGNTVAWRNVKVGASSLTRVQISAGLAEGDSVALLTDRSLRTGERIRPVYP